MAQKRNNMQKNKDTIHIISCAFKDAFPHTLPILAGYVLMGATFGILLQKAGFGVEWALFMSIFLYAGAMQFMCVGLLASGAGLFDSFVLALMINSRQIFYAISMLGVFGCMGKKRFYLIFSLTDETFALLHSKTPKNGVDSGWFMFFISFLNQIYWVMGCVLGSLLGGFVAFDVSGVEFVMSAIFVVIFIDQWRQNKNHTAAFVGMIVSVVCLLIFGKNMFLLPALFGICIVLFVCKRHAKI